MHLAAVDCTSNKGREICGKYGVGGYPTLKVFDVDKSNPSDYRHARAADAIVNFMGSAATSIKEAQLEKLRDEVTRTVSCDDDFEAFLDIDGEGAHPKLLLLGQKVGSLE